MRYWLLRYPYDAPLPDVQATIERLIPTAGGDRIALLEGTIGALDWSATRFFLYRGAQIDDISSGSAYRAGGQEHATINALWMSLLAKDRVAVRGLCRLPDGRHSVREISEHAWYRLYHSLEFPLGNLLRLLMQHFYGSYQAAFGNMPRNANLGRMRQWEEAARYLFNDIQERFIEPAYWARESQRQWSRMEAFLRNASPLESQIFRAETPSPAPEALDTPQPLSALDDIHETPETPRDFTIPFSHLVDIANAWEPELHTDGRIQSRDLKRLQDRFRYGFNMSATELPPFPGGLNDEI